MSTNTPPSQNGTTLIVVPKEHLDNIVDTLYIKCFTELIFLVFLAIFLVVISRKTLKLYGRTNRDTTGN